MPFFVHPQGPPEGRGKEKKKGDFIESSVTPTHNVLDAANWTRGGFGPHLFERGLIRDGPDQGHVEGCEIAKKGKKGRKNGIVRNSNAQRFLKL